MGTTFKIYFPRVQRAVATKPVDTVNRIAQADLHGSETILLVEDESAVPYAALEFLKKCGYSVIEAQGRLVRGRRCQQTFRPHRSGRDRRCHARDGRRPARRATRRKASQHKSALHVRLRRDDCAQFKKSWICKYTAVSCKNRSICEPWGKRCARCSPKQRSRPLLLLTELCLVDGLFQCLV